MLARSSLDGLAYLSTCLLAFLPTYLPTYSLTRLLAYSPTYVCTEVLPCFDPAARRCSSAAVMHMHAYRRCGAVRHSVAGFRCIYLKSLASMKISGAQCMVDAWVGGVRGVNLLCIQAVGRAGMEYDTWYVRSADRQRERENREREQRGEMEGGK